AGTQVAIYRGRGFGEVCLEVRFDGRGASVARPVGVHAARVVKTRNPNGEIVDDGSGQLASCEKVIGPPVVRQPLHVNRPVYDGAFAAQPMPTSIVPDDWDHA